MVEQMELNALEAAAAALRTGSGTLAAVIDAFLLAPLAVPTTTDPKSEQFSPVLTEVGGVVHMVVASRPALLERTSGIARFAISMSGNQIASGIQPGFGVMVNVPDGAFQLTPDELAAARGRA